MNSDHIRLGFKQLDTKNWLLPDMLDFFGLTSEKWFSIVTRAKLSAQVPLEIEKLLEVARGSLLYGWFFYPLLTLGIEQLFRVHEAAVRKRSELAGLSLKKTIKRGGVARQVDQSFSDLVEMLIKAKIIPGEDRKLWNAARSLRNSASHPSRQSIHAPSDAAFIITSSVNRINQLFGAKNPDGVAFRPD